MKKLLSIILCVAMIFTLSLTVFAGPAGDSAGEPGQNVEAEGESQGESQDAQAPAGESGGESADESGGESGGESGSGGSQSDPAEPTYTTYAEANPDKAIILDGVAMGQVRQLYTNAAVIYEGGVLDEEHSTGEGIEEKDGKTFLTSTADDEVGIIIRNTGSFVLGGESDPALVAEKINFSYITGEFYPDWDKFCESMGYEAGKTLEEIAQDMVDNGQTERYTDLGLERPEKVVLNDYVLDMSGIGSNDMGGFGAAVYVSDNADAEINNFRIITRGPCRGAIFTRFDADLTVNDSTIYAVSDPNLMTMQGCPPGLFLEGKVRATNAVGGSCVTYNNSAVVSVGWGALSTDSDDLYTVQGNPTELHINDSYIGVLTSGYGAYSDGAAEDYFKGSVIDVPDYGAVETGKGVVSFEDCVLNVGMYGVMTHSGNSTGNIIFKNSELHVGESAVMLRDTANNVLIDNCTIAFDGTYNINPELAKSKGVDLADLDAEFGTSNGVDEAYAHTIFKADGSKNIVKLIHNSDGGSGTESTGAAPVVKIANSTMAGNILNTAAMTGDEYTATSGPAGNGIRTPRSLDVTLDNSKITGVISLGQDTWEVTYFASGANTNQTIGFAKATEYGMFCEDGYGLKLNLTNGSVWNVTETSYLTSLTLDPMSAIKAPEGQKAVMTVNGVETEIAAGTFEGEIIISTKAENEYTIKDASYTLWVNTDYINVRKLATTDSDIIGQITFTNKVDITGEVLKNGQKTDWVRVNYDGQTGYMNTYYMSNYEPQTQPETTTSEEPIHPVENPMKSDYATIKYWGANSDHETILEASTENYGTVTLELSDNFEQPIGYFPMEGDIVYIEFNSVLGELTSIELFERKDLEFTGELLSWGEEVVIKRNDHKYTFSIADDIEMPMGYFPEAGDPVAYKYDSIRMMLTSIRYAE